jgi:eukaryotic-like serine/threonine-protein kinase
MAGQLLGDRYKVEKQLGKQAGRWTLRARDMVTGDQVVVKLLFVDDELDPEDLKLFGREVKTLQTINHPCVPNFLAYFEESLPNSRAIALVQSYVPGMSLQKILDRGRIFTEDETQKMAVVLLKIIGHLHSHNPPILHRDLKPSSIVLGQDRRPHLVDFGTVKALKSMETVNFTIVGTYGYMPPEQFSGRTVLASDLYSLGMTLIAMLTGKAPTELPRKGGYYDLTSVCVSDAFTTWLQQITATNLNRRLRSVDEALEALEAVSQPIES